ncbi:hypothetical protein CAQUA_08340 [Corynebacterium aquatimens]|uniref:Plasmid stability protein n=3 Tax=Corynebacterium aquatimens TaxID=1190508 RepID=A0A931GSP4_9CORY|nr:plasmid stability protein [Corynebacterium aquatimens]WJY66362.1 hypothetical protein CAQUA_08340 [Corynebacterium aquatimens]
MTAMTIRGLDATVKQRLAAHAKRIGRSMEAEARHIIYGGTMPRNLGLSLYEDFRDFSGADLNIPPREDPARVADLT